MHRWCVGIPFGSPVALALLMACALLGCVWAWWTLLLLTSVGVGVQSLAWVRRRVGRPYGDPQGAPFVFVLVCVALLFRQPLLAGLLLINLGLALAHSPAPETGDADGPL